MRYDVRAGMRALVVAFVAIVLVGIAAAPSARADDAVGVVVTGDPAMQPEVAQHLERWLKKHGHRLVASPLSADAINTVVNCLTVDDPKCARGVVEARSKSDNLVYARVDILPSKRKDKDIAINAYWFSKGHEPIGERRVCEKCSEDAWRGIADRMMGALAGSGEETGRLRVMSNPSGVIVVLDHNQIGTTPIERDVPAGNHTIQLTHAGRTVATRDVEVKVGDTTRVMMHPDVTMETPGDASPPSRVPPIVVLSAGAAALGVGIGFIYYGELGGKNQKFIYPDSTPIGVGISVVGAAATIGGAIWLVQTGHASAPVATIGANSGYIGWMARF